MSDRPARRVAVVVGSYAVGAWLVMGVADWVRRVLALPGLFETLLRAGLILGVPLAAALAWRYPELAHGDEPERRDAASPGTDGP